ncbi:MAG: cytochrome c [Rhodobacteraceae bacterium]|nr:cytochrome c [Paracoccaceae bacterium]
MKRKIAWTAGAALCVLGACLGAEEGDGARGEALYLEHCVACHGVDVMGNGPMAGVMIIKPSDLTALSVDNGGAFPLVRVIKRIDGRDPLVSHGSPMPVYGSLFEGHDLALRTESGQPIMTSQPVADLVVYLQGVQK